MGILRFRMVCPNDNCLRELQPGWMSCPHCGCGTTDGASRPDEGECDHQFVIEGPFCIVCGFLPEMGYRAERISMRLVATAMVVILIVISLYLGSRMVDPTLGQDAVIPSRAARNVSWLLAASLVALAFAIGWLVKLLTRRPD